MCGSSNLSFVVTEVSLEMSRCYRQTTHSEGQGYTTPFFFFFFNWFKHSLIIFNLLLGVFFWLLGVDSTEMNHGFPARFHNSSDFPKSLSLQKPLNKITFFPCNLPLQFLI